MDLDEIKDQVQMNHNNALASFHSSILQNPDFSGIYPIYQSTD